MSSFRIDELGLRRRMNIDALAGLDNLISPSGRKPNEPHTPSGIHQRRWCMFHQKNCCMKHGPKHKRGKILKGPKTKKGLR